MNFKGLATQILIDKTGNTNSSVAAESALDKLVVDQRGFDLTEIVRQLRSYDRDLARRTRSWLGDGENASVSPDKVVQAMGASRVKAFAATLGIDGQEAASSLSEFLPELIDRSSQGGRLLGDRKSALADLTSRLFHR